MHKITERDLTSMANEVLGNVQEEFEDFFLRRQERFEEMLADYEMKLEDKKRQYEILSGDIARVEQANHFGPSRVKSIAVQTHFAALASGMPSSPTGKSSESMRAMTPRSKQAQKSMIRGSLLQRDLEIPLFSPTQKRVSTPSTRASSIQPSRATSRCDNSRPGSSMDLAHQKASTPRVGASRPLAPVLRSSSRAESRTSNDERTGTIPDAAQFKVPAPEHPPTQVKSEHSRSSSRPGSGGSQRDQSPRNKGSEVSGGPPPPPMPAPPPPMPSPPE